MFSTKYNPPSPLQSFGLVLSLYMLVSNYLEESPAYNDPTTNLCTEAALCLFFRYGPLHNQVLQAMINQLTQFSLM